MPKKRIDSTNDPDRSWSEWYPLTHTDMRIIPAEAGLINVRATKDDEPIEIEHPKSIDTGGLLYIKGEANIQEHLRSIQKAFTEKDLSHSVFANYFADSGEAKYPIEGLEFRYSLLNTNRKTDYACPNGCGPFNGHTEMTLDDEAMPGPGSFLICDTCCSILMITDGNEVKETTPEDIAQLPEKFQKQLIAGLMALNSYHAQRATKLKDRTNGK